MKKTLSLFFSVLFFGNSALASSQDSLAISQWDYDAINATHVFYPKKIGSQKDKCIPDLENIGWFSTQQGEAIFSSEGCSVYISTHDGWITKYHSQTKQALAKIRVGLKTANATLSKDNKILLVGNRQPADLVLLNAHDLSVARVIPVKNNKGIFSPVAKVRTAGDDHGFIIAPQDFPTIWKISYLNPAPIGFGDGWNHDYRCMDEHISNPLFPVKRLKTGQYLTDLQIDNEGIFLVGTNKSGQGLVMDLDLSRVISHPKIVNIESGIIWKTDKSNYLASLNKDKNTIVIYSNIANPRHWKKIKDITVNPAITIASCPESPVLWVSSQKSEIQLIDKNSLELLKTLPLNSDTQINKMACLPSRRAIILNGKNNKPVIYDSLTFKQLY